MFELNTYTILLWITGILILSFDFVVYSGSKNRSSILFAFFSSFVALWSISYGFIVASTNSEIPLYLMKINHILGMIASLGFICFSISYPDDKTIKTNTKLWLIIIGLIFFVLLFFTELMIPSMFYLSSPDRWGWKIGNLYFLYCITFNFLWITILYNIWKKISDSNKPAQRINQLFMFWGLAIGILPPAVLNVILPFFGIYGLSWTGPIASALWIFIIGYSIIRYRQMDVKVIITEVLAIAMTVIFFINIFTQTHYGVWENIVTFLVFLFLAVFLIRGVLTESRQKEELRILNETLEDKVAEQTQDIRKAFELEKKAKRDLEKLNETKDQFILITQHSLRSPLHSIKSGIDEIGQKTRSVGENAIEKSFGKIRSGTERLSKVTDDFLAITTIKAGSSILDPKNHDLKSIIDNILNILRFDIEDKDITIKFDNRDQLSNILNIDGAKIHDALLIIIENAIRYNVSKGQITFAGKIEFDRFILQITDNGNGISKEDMERISHNLFHRGSVARKLNPIGMGIGLSVARSIIKAHQGELTVESEGENCGTRVTISLPIN